jgi:cytochrome c biogenesis protein CcdA
MTLIFGLGIATILVPTALGIRAIGNLFQNFHTETYLVGGAFMIFLGLLNLIGKKFTLPMINLTIDLARTNNPWSVYTLGVFSGITSSCCTPVLAGILTLTFLSPNFMWAAAAGFSYVAGMVTPLVALALLLEKINWASLTRIRTTTIALPWKTILLTDAVAGIIFLGIGVLFIYLAQTGQVVMQSQHEIESTLGIAMTTIARSTRQIPGAEYLFFAALAVAFVILLKLKK